jgi:acetylornithine deacetylase/succinyl-diaminopimelate desuccinylase-like protein
MAEEIADWLCRELGAELVPQGFAASPPIVHARIDAGRPTTVILYNMYDVMPAEPDGWLCDPFGGEVGEMAAIGSVLVARGAENNKGPLAGMLVALKDLMRHNKLPVNVELIIEGEEETGSRALRSFLQDRDCPVRPASSALFASLCEYGGGPPRLYLGFSGIAKGVARAEPGAWGGPSRPIHSSNAPWIANPASRLVEAIGLLGSPPTGRIAAIALDPQAKALITRLANGFDAAAELRFRASSAFAVEGSNADKLATLLSTATVNLTWLATEPVRGDGIIPCRAEAGIEVRTPPELDLQQLLDQLVQSLSDGHIAGVGLEVMDASPGYRFHQGAAGISELLNVYARHGRPAQVWPWAPGAAPAYAFARYTEAFLIGGLGRGGDAHGVNEFMAIESIDRFIASVIGWLTAMSGNASTGARTDLNKEEQAT